jgi:anti-sigma regulatory factor (Ser/Thr protein kinase)
VAATTPATEAFRHEALLYDGTDDLVRRAVPFVRAGIERDEPVMVAVRAATLERLRDALGADAAAVRLVDMEKIGRNPARIIPAWREFARVNARPGRALRGIGEPIWSGRSEAELVECQLHESLLNVAFADVADFHLLCPYDTSALAPEVVHEALCSHPHVAADEGEGPSRHFRGLDVELDGPLPRPPARARTLAFDAASLREVREVVARCAAHAGLSDERRDDAVVAVHEAVTNSVRHGGGMGVLRLWSDDDGLLADVRDRGHIRDPLVGRHGPHAAQLGGWGLWIANQVCDLVQIRTRPSGTVVRLLLRRGAPA